MDWKEKIGFLLLFLLAASGPQPAAAADATLYELLENMSIVQRDGENFREGWAALEGTARPGTPLCPLPVTCTVHVTGKSSVKVTTGEGRFEGKFAVVVQGDNDVDGPEAVMLTGEVEGAMDFSPAFLAGQPYGLVHGTMKVDNQCGESPFTGIFHLPFVTAGDLTNTPLYLVFSGLVPNGTVVPVSAEERALGRPTVKFEIVWEPALARACDPAAVSG